MLAGKTALITGSTSGIGLGIAEHLDRAGADIKPDGGFPHHSPCPAGHDAEEVGRIIQIASAHALVASPFKSAYVAAKHGIAGLTKTVALVPHANAR